MVRRARQTLLRRRRAALSPAVEALERLAADEPLGGRLYRVQWDDTPGRVIKMALQSCDIDQTRERCTAYAHLIGAGEWNRTLYGSASSSRAYPSRWLVPGLGTGSRAAWRSRNMDAMAAIIEGGRVRCTIDRKTGAAASPWTSYGLIWLPPVTLEGWDLTTSHTQWDDGSSTLDPPRAILERLDDDG